MRFVHVADVHLDTSFAGRSESVRQRLRDASRQAFRSAVDLAIREDVHAFLIAGDLFDGERLSFATERFLLEETGRLGDHGITVVYAQGNHDPGSPEAGPRPLPWPSNVRVADVDTPNRVVITDRTGRRVGCVTTIGHASSDEQRDLSRLFPAPEGDVPEVGLLHTQVHASSGAADHHPYAPSELAYLRRAGFDYWALGHVHVRQSLSDDPTICYAGSLQGRTHAERGERGALLVDLSDRNAPAVSFRALAPVRWETVEVDRLEEVESLDALERRIQLVWDGARQGDPGRSTTDWMVRVSLEGACPLWAVLGNEDDRALLAGELRDLLGVLDVVVVTDKVRPVIPLEEHRGRTDVLGEALRLCEAVGTGAETLDDVASEELVGLVSDDPSSVEAYVRDLLDGADAELAARVLDEDSVR